MYDTVQVTQHFVQTIIYIVKRFFKISQNFLKDQAREITKNLQTIVSQRFTGFVVRVTGFEPAAS